MPDRIDKLVDQWSQQRPNLNGSGLDVIARVQNVAKMLRREDDNALALLRLEIRKYDVLSALHHQRRMASGLRKAITATG